MSNRYADFRGFMADIRGFLFYKGCKNIHAGGHVIAHAGGIPGDRKGRPYGGCHAWFVSYTSIGRHIRMLK